MFDSITKNITNPDISLNPSSDETTLNTSEYLSTTNNSILDSEQSFVAQQNLYGSIKPSPTKLEHNVLELPKLQEKLTLPKQRKRTNSMDATYYKIGGDNLNNIERGNKRPSTCGKEGLRNFSTPLPQKIESINDYDIPYLTPDISSTVDDTRSSLFDTPVTNNTKLSSPLSVRVFSTPLADLRSSSTVKTAVQIKLNQLSSKEYNDEYERQLQRDILKYQSEINKMKKIKKYRDSKEDQKLDQLIEKWRDIAEKGSNFLFNEAKLKIERMGGIEEFRKKQKRSKLRKMKFEFDESLLYKIEEYMESDEYKNIEGYEKEEIISRKKELEKISEQIENGQIPRENNQNDDSSSENDEFTMEELYKQLGLDYKIVYGS
ncbi:hypothetical protein C6P42_001308 [Pichia californica]|nr:hypothetical protein C6P42_001308 [[Candida] californica]